MTTLTAWNRIETSPRAKELELGLQARIADPLWLLSRQWQMGEFLGEDAASPVEARVSMEKTQISQLRLRSLEDDRQTVVESLPSGPLEAIIEREEVLQGPSVTQRSIESGLHFLRILDRYTASDAQARRQFRAFYPLAAVSGAEAAMLDGESARFLALMTGRAVDGAALRGAVEAAGADLIPSTLTFAEALVERVRSAITEWIAWYDTRFSEPTSGLTAWVRERMEYTFGVSAPLEDREVVLEAPEHHGGHLDWFSFDVSSEASLGETPQTSAAVKRAWNMLPTSMSYPGMPASRFWEFEDARVHMARYTAGPADISKILLVEYAMVYGDDWFRIPIDLDIGDLVRIDTLVVRDNFDDLTNVPPAEQVDVDSSWRLFAMHNDPALLDGEESAIAGIRKGPWLFRPPSLARNLNGEALEEVAFTRDEMANLAWAIERTIECAAGKPVSRAERWLAKQRRAASQENAEPTVSADARYNIQTIIPDFWLPLVPVKLRKSDSAMILRRGRSLMPDGALSPPALGRILDPGRKLLVYEEEVPKSGVSVTRRWQLARWLDGSTWLWLSRTKKAGHGERSSGVRYDLIEE
jgi:hypothetical protein